MAIGPKAGNGMQVSESLAKLFGEMRAQRKQLRVIIEFCREERTSDEVDEMLASVSEQRVSVYAPMRLRALLERAGALVYVDHDDAPDEVRDEDGNLVVPERLPEGGWVATPEALAFCAGMDPDRELAETLMADSENEEVYARVLDMCQGDGSAISDIEHALEEVLPDAPMRTGFFVGRLEDAGAIEWRGSWVLTELGRRYIGA